LGLERKSLATNKRYPLKKGIEHILEQTKMLAEEIKKAQQDRKSKK